MLGQQLIIFALLGTALCWFAAALKKFLHRDWRWGAVALFASVAFLAVTWSLSQMVDPPFAFFVQP